MAARKVADMVEINLRLPATMKAELQERAGRNLRSMNSEILLLLQAALRRAAIEPGWTEHNLREELRDDDVQAITDPG